MSKSLKNSTFHWDGLSLYLPCLFSTSAVISFPWNFHSSHAYASIGDHTTSWIPSPPHRETKKQYGGSERGCPASLGVELTQGFGPKPQLIKNMFLYFISPSVYMGQDWGVRMLSPHQIPSFCLNPSFIVAAFTGSCLFAQIYMEKAKLPCPVSFLDIRRTPSAKRICDTQFSANQ